MIAGERVWVVPRAELFPESAPHGYVPGGGETFRRIYECGHFADRAPVEEDPSLKQVIPYALLARDDEIFLFRRKRGGGERRLYGLRSVGVGGHVNPPDASDVILDALRREVEEEVRVAPGWSASVVGLLNDDTTAVGSVHVGVVAVVDPGAGPVEVREADTMSGSFVSRAELLELHARERDTFESWSALLLDRLDEVLACRPRNSTGPTPSATRTSTT